ncbi:hypothetical protein HNQ92_001915 [Rhabdobacter roseus]|uniref:Uncharacterized protein n=1 Tax=Rhabdobacter roseus TaxID=1655419 RepID=A0A840TVW0_9BACT|nr:hypothetical protein [Rhabdobacter roseus]MBB5283789.1 hypothetical protein [Rhabdobacter roseus]
MNKSKLGYLARSAPSNAKYPRELETEADSKSTLRGTLEVLF